MAKNTREQKLQAYLTQMKELPPLGDTLKELPETRQSGSKPVLKEAEGAKKRLVQAEKNQEEKSGIVKQEDELSERSEEGKNLPITSRDIILGIVNIVSVILLIIILLRLPSKASELKSLRIEDLRSQSDVSYEVFDIDSYKQKAQELERLFLDEGGIVQFVSEVEKIAKVSFTSQKAVKDKSGNFGLPVVFEFSGSWEEVDRVMQTLDKLPFLFRVVKVEARRLKEDPKVIQFKYGVMLYVKDEFGEN